MRNYPSVPNVFRVASTHSVNNEATYAPGKATETAGKTTAALGYAKITTGGVAAAATSGTTSATSHDVNDTIAINVIQCQQQQKGAQQSLANAAKTIKIGGTPSTPTSGAATASTASMFTAGTRETIDSNTFGSSYDNEQLKQKQYQQNQQQQLFRQQQQHQQRLQQQQQLHFVGGLNVNGGSGVSNCNGNEAIINKLTTTASVECSSSGEGFQNGRAQFQQQLQQQKYQQHQKHLLQSHSPYATLPRTFAINGGSNGDLRHNNDANNANGGRTGVINTISGSIPATGFAANGRVTSMGSHLNLALNNSCSDLGKLNSDAAQSSQRQQQHRQQHEDYRFTRISKDIEGHDFSFKRTAAMSTQTASSCSRRSSAVNNSNSNNSGYLWILTPVAASISVAIVIAALAGPQWLFTEEKLPNSLYNGTGNFNTLDDGAFITKYTKSSLWILCTTLQGIETYNCIKIDYFSKEGYQPDPHDSTSAIPYTVTKSCPFFLASGIALLISFIVFLIPTCSHQNSLYYFSAGIMFIVSGLLMLIGLIAYISILKAEIGSKLRPRSSLQPALFKVNYGQSFFLFVFGFITTEFVGLLNIFLYISLQEISYYSRLPCFTLANVREKIKEGKNPRSQTYKSYKHANPSTSQNENKPMQRRRANNGQLRQVHNVRAPLPQHLAGGETLPKTCRRHPNATMEPNNFDLERRYYFDDATPSMIMKCNLNTRNLAKSLNELYTEPVASPPAPAPPPPSTIKAGTSHAQTLPRQLQQQSPTVARFADLPQEFPLTRSVSTTTEIFQNNNDFGAATATPLYERRQQRRNMATNTKQQTLRRPTDTTTEVRRNECSDTRQLAAANRRRQQSSEMRHSSNAQRNSNHLGDNNDDGDDLDVNVDDGDNDDELLDDEEPQRLCGLKRGIRKTKDELFQEFCKRAGMRPKPKNIYYIANEEEMLRRKRHSGDLGGGGGGSANANKTSAGHGTLVDDLEFVEEEDGFKQLDAQNELVYGVEAAYLARNMRRASMFVEPTHLRKLNSNLSLHTLYPTDNRAATQKAGLYDIIRTEVPNEHWPVYPIPLRGAYGGSQSRLDSNNQLNQNRATLPRSFLRSNNSDSQDSIASASMQALNNAYSASQTRLSNLMLHSQQPQHQLLMPHDRLLALSRGTVGYLHKSYDDLNASNYMPDAAHKPINSNTLQQPVIQWPAAIPSSPSNFGGNYTIYGTTAARAHPQATALQHGLVTRSASSGGSGVGANGQTKFQRAYAFDEQRRVSAAADAFDLDEIERERRRSHASLFNGVLPLGVHNFAVSNNNNSPGDQYDCVNGTAV